jgi:hypothetical protein
MMFRRARRKTLRSMLLNAYGWWKASQITYIISLVLFGVGTVAGLGSGFLFAFGRDYPAGRWCPAVAAGHCDGMSATVIAQIISFLLKNTACGDFGASSRKLSRSLYWMRMPAVT